MNLHKCHSESPGFPPGLFQFWPPQIGEIPDRRNLWPLESARVLAGVKR
jgi:hypothetical protein